MATYSLSGSGTQTLTTGVTALHVTISTLPAGAGHGLASPTDYWGVGSLRPGNATAFWEPFVICGGPQWLAVPFGTTRLGYAFAASAVVSVAEVFGSYPLSSPLAGLPDVTLSSPADAQVLAYQASSAKWINATPASGPPPGLSAYLTVTLAASAASVRMPVSGSLPSTFGHLELIAETRCDISAAQFTWLRFNGSSSGIYDHQSSRGQSNQFAMAPTINVGQLQIGQTPGTSATAGASGIHKVLIPNYSGTTFWKEVVGQAYMATVVAVTGQTIDTFGGTWRSTAAITDLLVLPASGNFIAGSVFSLYITT